MNITDRKQYTFQEALKTLDRKKGAGKAKKTRIKIDMDIQVSSGKPAVEMLLKQFNGFMELILNHQSSFAGYSLKNVTIKEKNMIQTEHEDNPDW